MLKDIKFFLGKCFKQMYIRHFFLDQIDKTLIFSFDILEMSTLFLRVLCG